MMKDVNKSTTYSVPLGNAKTLTASWPGSSYVWHGSTNSERSITITNSNLDTKFYTVTDQYGCITDNFTIQTSSLALPTNVTHFQAGSKGLSVKLKWITAHETHNSHFTLEKSSDGVNFDFLSKLKGAGTSAIAHTYTFDDLNPTAGPNFYRLSQTDLDGKTSILGIRKVMYQPPKSIDVVGMAGAAGLLKLEISLAEKGSYQLQIVDMSGRRWHSGQVNLPAGKSTKQMQLPPGEYIWELSDGKEMKVFQKIMLR